MSALPPDSNSENICSDFQIIRGKQANQPLHAAIVGGGQAGCNLLKLLDEARLSRLNMHILGLSDENPEAPGIRLAKAMGLFTTTRFEDLFDLEGINLIIELTGSTQVRNLILEKKPSEVSVMDHRASRVLWDLLQMETEKYELEKKYKEHELKTKIKTQVILDSLPYRIMVVNMDLTVDAVNQTFIREFELDDKAIEGRHCYELRYHLDKPCRQYGRVCYLEDRLDEIIDKGLFNTVREFVDEAGETRYEVITLAPIFGENGKLVQILEASRDVTEKSKLEKEYEKSNTFLENVIESTVDGIVVVDTKGNVQIFNEGMERLTGYSAEEIIEHGHLTFFYDINVAKENMLKMRSHEHGSVGKLNPTAMSIGTKDGKEVPVTLSASIITIDGKEIGSVGVFTDMREILQMRKELEDTHLQLVQSEKVASVGRMAAGVAHEINNPLSGVLIYAELLKDELKDNPRYLADIQEIIDQTLRCKKIVSELLEFSRQSVGKTASISLEYLINKCLDLLIHQAIFQDIEVVKVIQPHMPQMVGDMGQLQQVFTNLFINAAHAMETKGKLRIYATYNEKNAMFVIEVSDTGPGVPPELREKIFEIFFTTKPVGTGTGLGLSISQNIIKLHGGKLSLSCPSEGGSTFTIEIPLECPEGQKNQEAVFIGLDES